ncbi:Nem1-Spo7 phosphatase regulatory subunit [Knufia obscura]|uniref:Nem1-Spo7 phosphatase regulatory subunit n=2 Tax=Knufia TaxID=430999 RepID=A0AAN8EM98_9EURO|nr:Nem1-Spo7 phosphatase regulatory subunit [Knufia obscura]KAK5958428.1 Nem1-Spo7 phosphatase regulatory subunit [Knufia fluminis]
MATETSLNQIVKGAPPPGTKVREPSPLPPLAKASAETVDALVAEPTPARETPPQPWYHQRPTPTILQPPATTLINTDNLPSSPPQIYLNLLILESSLRQQYLTLLSRRRLNTFFIALLGLWNLTFSYFLFLRPREDGSGKLGGSPYWVVEAAIRLGFIAGVVAALLIKATGQWEAGIRWPRKWLSVTNRGIRGFNLRVVVVKRSFWKETTSYIRALAPWAGLADGSGDWHLVESPPTPSEVELGKTAGSIVEEDLSPSGDHLLLLLLPKNFSSEFRENWETYRSEYWERENERRTSLRRKVAVHKRNKAKEVGGWKWWTGAWRVIPHASHRKKNAADLEKHPHGHHHAGHHRTDSRRNSTLPPGAEKVQDALAAAKASRRRSLLRDSSTHSRQSSRSSTPHYMLDGTMEMIPADSKKDRVRRGSSVSSTGSARRTLRSTTGSVRRGEGLLSPLTMTDEPGEIPPKRERKRRDRPGTPSVSSTESIAEDGMKIKKEPSPS